MYIELFCVMSTRLRKEKKGGLPVHCVKRIEDKLFLERNPYQKYRKSPEVLWVKSSQRIMYLENCTYCVHSSQCPALYIYFQKIYISIYTYAATLKGTHGWHSNSDLPKSGLLIRQSKGYTIRVHLKYAIFSHFWVLKEVNICFLTSKSGSDSTGLIKDLTEFSVGWAGLNQTNRKITFSWIWAFLIRAS